MFGLPELAEGGEGLKRIYRMTVMVLAAICLILSGGCRLQTTDTGPTTTFLGTVVDSATMIPIDSARVVLSDTLEGYEAAFSDSTGRFELVGRGVGRFDVFCQKQGYNTKSVTLFSNFLRNRFDDMRFALAK